MIFLLIVLFVCFSLSGIRNYNKEKILQKLLIDNLEIHNNHTYKITQVVNRCNNMLHMYELQERQIKLLQELVYRLEKEVYKDEPITDYTKLDS
jgi:hypothetical protein